MPARSAARRARTFNLPSIRRIDNGSFLPPRAQQTARDAMRRKRLADRRR